MWLYFPRDVMGSLCALEQEGWSWDSISRSHSLELFVGSRGTHTLRPLSWPEWKTRVWMKRLSGLILQPSMQLHGAESWISALPDTPASRSHPAENGEGRKIRGICGPMSPGSRQRLRFQSSSARTFTATSALVSKRSEMTFAIWVTKLKQDSSQRQKSARATRGCASSFWHTPTASCSGTWPEVLTGKNGWEFRPGEHQTSIDAQARAWMVMMQLGAVRPLKFAEDLPPIRMIIKAGKKSLPFPLILNPCFLELLMGWPIGWTDSGSQVTGLSLWLQLMRGRLWSLMQRSN